MQGPPIGKIRKLIATTETTPVGAELVLLNYWCDHAVALLEYYCKHFLPFPFPGTVAQHTPYCATPIMSLPVLAG